MEKFYAGRPCPKCKHSWVGTKYCKGDPGVKGEIYEHRCDCDLCEVEQEGAYVDICVEASEGNEALKLVEANLEDFVRWVPGSPAGVFPMSVRIDWG